MNLLRITLAALHLLALGIGLGAVLTRGSLLRRNVDATALRLALRYDAIWGIAALLWIATGLWRYLGSVEKSMSYYNGSHLFLTKMALLVVIFALEAPIARRLGEWRKALARGEPAETIVADGGRKVATVSHIEAGIVVVMVVLATAMARGFGG